MQRLALIPANRTPAVRRVLGVAALLGGLAAACSQPAPGGELVTSATATQSQSVAPSSTPSHDTTSAPSATAPGTQPSASTTPSASVAATSAAPSASSGAPACVPVVTASRQLLSETGLYCDTAKGVLAPGVEEYHPQFELWSDGADKRRWIYLPEGTQINTKKLGDWVFPVGTRLWKEFTRDGVRIETRMIEKLPPERAAEGLEGWLMLSFIWNDAQTDGLANKDGVQNAKGTPHDVPSKEQCGDCHDSREEKPLGFSAVQLAHGGDGITLDKLVAAGRLSVPPTAPIVVPGDEKQRQMLGYFHANCGHCHRKNSPVNSRVSTLQLWLETDHLASFEETNMYGSLVSAFTESAHGSVNDYRVYGGDLTKSELWRRLSFREEHQIQAPLPPAPSSTASSEPGPDDVVPEHEVPMPPLGTEVGNEPVLTITKEWILSLPPPAPATTASAALSVVASAASSSAPAPSSSAP